MFCGAEEKAAALLCQIGGIDSQGERAKRIRHKSPGNFLAIKYVGCKASPSLAPYMPDHTKSLTLQHTRPPQVINTNNAVYEIQ